MSEVSELLRKERGRLQAKALYGLSGDSISIRAPGRGELLFSEVDAEIARTVEIEADAEDGAGLHAAIYRARPDAGAIVISRTPWSEALSRLEMAVPTMFDEQARHIGKGGAPIPTGRRDLAVAALRRGGNVVIYGDRRICLGATPGRVALNAELFEKCAKAFVIAWATGSHVHELPAWMRYVWSWRLRKAQRRAAAAHEVGAMPEGVDSY